MKDAAAPGNAADPAPLLIPALTAAQLPVDVDGVADLPPAGDQPAWQRDLVSISTRVRAVLATLRPLAVRVLSYWDHVQRGVSLGSGRTLEIDPSGSYRLRIGG